jgi:hypothetical protein
MAQDYHIFVSSSDALSNDDNTNFLVGLNQVDTGRGQQGFRIGLEYITFTNSNAVVNPYQNKIYFSENGGATLTATLDTGNYDSTTFIAEIQAEMNSVSGVGSPYTVTFDSTTNKLNINTSSTSLELISGINTVYHVMGFTSAGIELGALTDYLSDGILDLSGSKTLSVEINPLDRYGFSSSNTTAYQTIPLVSAYGFVELYMPDTIIFKHIRKPNLRELSVRLVDDRGNQFYLASNTYVSMNFILRPIE